MSGHSVSGIADLERERRLPDLQHPKSVLDVEWMFHPIYTNGHVSLL
jgi:hypothetical protein